MSYKDFLITFNVIAGDFNIHIDNAETNTAEEFITLLKTFGVCKIIRIQMYSIYSFDCLLIIPFYESYYNFFYSRFYSRYRTLFQNSSVSTTSVYAG